MGIVDGNGTGLSRRALLVGVARVGAVASVARVAEGLAFGSTGDTLPAENGPAALPGPPLEEFGYDQVSVTGERQRAQLANVRSILLGLDEDSLLQPFRQMSGLPAPGRSLGGWYEWKPDYDYHHDDAGLAPGATFGQWVSAMARLSASTGDATLGERAVRLNGLIAAIPPGELHGYFAQTRFPAYSFDKMVCGLMDAYRLAGDATALATLDQVRAAADPELPGGAFDRDVQAKTRRAMMHDASWTWDESYTVPENLFLVSRMMPPAQAARYRQMAVAYLNDATLFAPLARGENVLADKHAYSYVNSLCSAMQAYLTGGSAMHLEAARNGFAMVAAQSFATGGWGPDELLRKPGSQDVAASLVRTHNSFETPCGSYAHMKLTRYLLRATREGLYGDSMERVMLNTVLGALPLEPDGRSFYYSDYNQMARRVYSDHRWPCCSGTLPQVVADYGMNSYLREPSAADRAGGAGRPGAVWVILYQPSQLRWREGGAALALEQTGNYPESGEIRIRVSASQPAAFALHLRLPAWAGTGARVRVNGVAQPVEPGAASGNGFLTLDRTWRQEDLVELSLPLQLRLEALAGHAETVALLWGPLVLFALRQEGEAGPLAVTREALLGAQRVDARTWRVRAGSGERIFVPFTDLGERRYSTYVNLV